MGKKRILIIGDTIIDHNVYLEAVGLSLESPTIKTTFNKESFNFGGASNVARYAAKFGAQVTFITSLTKMMAQQYILENQVELLNVISNFDTVKTRNYIHKGDNQYNYLQINRVNETLCPIDFIEDINFDKFDSSIIHHFSKPDSDSTPFTDLK